MTSRSPIPNWLEQRARSSPDHTALIGAGRTLSFGQLAARAAALSGQLQSLGVRRGDRVAVLAGNRLEFAELLHGITRSGAVAVPIHRRLSAVEITSQLRQCEPALLVYESSARDVVTRLAPEVSAQRVCLDGDALSGDRSLRDLPRAEPGGAAPIDLDAVHTIAHTSGSSGNPKGVLLTWGNHFWNATGSAFNLGVHADDRWLACLPSSHVGGLAILLRGVLYGITVVVQELFEPAEVNRAIDAERVTIVSVVASMLQRMLEERGRRPYPPSLRCLLLGGGPAPRSLLERCVALAAPVVQTYGLTEAASQVATLAPRDALRKLGSAGRPLLTTELRLVDGKRDVGAGETGEIHLRGPTISPGYAGPAADDARPDGWLATGDLARFDDDGFLYVVGRADDMIISGGENVHPAEVEAVLQTHPAVAEACVFGVPDERWGEIVAAWVESRQPGSLDAGALQAHARRSLASYKIPRLVRFVDELPRTAAGKILRRHLRDQSRPRNQ